MSDLIALAEKPVSTRTVYRSRVCGECGTEFVPSRYQQEFCCEAHKKAFHNRSAAEGRAILVLAKAWRLSRNAKGNTPEAIAIRETGSMAFSELVSILDGFIADDREAGRPKPFDYVRRLLADGKRYMDRTWRGRA